MRARAPSVRLGWLAVGVLALALRLLHLWQIHEAPVFTHLVVDGIAYDAWAREVASGQWLGREVFYQAPLYPYFLATIYATVGRDLAVARVVQAMLGAVACVLLAFAGTRFFGRRVGLLAGLLLAAWPSAIFADGLIQKSVLDTFFVCALLAGLAVALESSRPARWMLPGIALGALALTRENALVFLPLLVGFVALRHRGRPAVAVRAVAALGIGAALLLAPVAIRNRVVGGELHLTTSQFGTNFFIGNNELATGGYRALRFARGDVQFERRDATELAEQALGRPLTPSEVSRYWTGRALEFIAREPGRWLRLMGRKAVLFVSRVETGDAEDQYTYGDWSVLLRLLTPILGFGLLVPLAVAGIVLAWDRGPARLLAALLAAYAATVVATFVMARYRHPALPLLLVFAAVVPLAVRGAPRGRLAIAGLLAAAIAVPANWPILSVASVRAGSLYNIARVLQDEPGGLDEAEGYYRRALEQDPRYALAYSNLGTVLERTGRFDEARTAFARAVELEPGRPEFVYNLAHVEAARGDGAAAGVLYERTLTLDPRHADAHTNLGVLLQQRGDLAAAARHYEAALAANPRHVTAMNARGVVYAQQGQLDAAIASFRSVLAIDPGNRSARENLAQALADAARRPTP